MSDGDDSDLSADFDEFADAIENMNNNDANRDNADRPNANENPDPDHIEVVVEDRVAAGEGEQQDVVDGDGARGLAEDLARVAADAAIQRGVDNLALIQGIAQANAAAVPGIDAAQAGEIAQAAAEAALLAAQARAEQEHGDGNAHANPHPAEDNRDEHPEGVPDPGVDGRRPPDAEAADGQDPLGVNAEAAGGRGPEVGRAYMFTQRQFDDMMKSRAPREDKIDKIKIPEFTSTDFEEFEVFRRQAQIAFSHNRWTDQAGKRHVANKFGGRAAVRTQHVRIGGDPADPDPQPDAKTFKSFMDEIQLCFIHPEESALAKSEFKGARQNVGESGMEWNHRCRVLYKRGYPTIDWNTSQDLMDQFIFGLVDERMSVYIADQQPKTYEQCLTLMQGKQGRTAQIRAGRAPSRSIRSMEDPQIDAVIDQPAAMPTAAARRMAAARLAHGADGPARAFGTVAPGEVNALRHVDPLATYDPYAIHAYNFVGDGLRAPTSKSANAFLRARGPPGDRATRPVMGTCSQCHLDGHYAESCPQLAYMRGGRRRRANTLPPRRRAPSRPATPAPTAVRRTRRAARGGRGRTQRQRNARNRALNAIIDDDAEISSIWDELGLDADLLTDSCVSKSAGN